MAGLQGSEGAWAFYGIRSAIVMALAMAASTAGEGLPSQSLNLRAARIAAQAHACWLSKAERTCKFLRNTASGIAHDRV